MIFSKEIITHIPTTHPKVWGVERWIVNNEDYCSKILFVDQAAFSSVHWHNNKKETFHCVSGYGYVEFFVASVKDVRDLREELCLAKELDLVERFELRPNQSIDILPGQCHRFVGLSKEPFQILEVSTHHEESDSFRFVNFLSGRGSLYFRPFFPLSEKVETTEKTVERDLEEWLLTKFPKSLVNIFFLFFLVCLPFFFTGCSNMNWHVNDPTSIEDGTLGSNWGNPRIGYSRWRYSYEAGSYYDVYGQLGPSLIDIGSRATSNAGD